MSTELTHHKQEEVSLYSSLQTFTAAHEIAVSISKSGIIPPTYQNKPENVMIALEMANRTKTSWMAIMQNTHIIQGKPSWSAQFVTALIDNCGRFSPLRWRFGTNGVQNFKCWMDGKQVDITIDDVWCEAYARDLYYEGEIITGPRVSMGMAILDGWYGKKDSKWKSMPQVMLQYRSAALFGRMYCPDLLMGMKTQDEYEDIHGPSTASKAADKLEILNQAAQKPSSKKAGKEKPADVTESNQEEGSTDNADWW